MANRLKVVVVLLVLIVVILAGILLYAFVLKPKVTGYLTGYTTQGQIQGVQFCVGDILSQLQQNGFVQFPLGNQTLILVPYTPPTPIETPVAWFILFNFDWQLILIVKDVAHSRYNAKNL